MVAKFEAVMAKMAVLGHNPNTLIDCSEVVPVPKPAVNKPASFPATKGPQDLELTCKTKKFPSLTVDREYTSLRNVVDSSDILWFAAAGVTETLIPHCSNGGMDCPSIQFDGPA